jgi:hypothetical protein
MTDKENNWPPKCSVCKEEYSSDALDRVLTDMERAFFTTYQIEMAILMGEAGTVLLQCTSDGCEYAVS